MKQLFKLTNKTISYLSNQLAYDNKSHQMDMKYNLIALQNIQDKLYYF